MHASTLESLQGTQKKVIRQSLKLKITVLRLLSFTRSLDTPTVTDCRHAKFYDGLGYYCNPLYRASSHQPLTARGLYCPIAGAVPTLSLTLRHTTFS